MAAACRTNVGSINEAKEVEQRDGGDDHQVDLPPQLGLGGRIEGHERPSISIEAVSAGNHKREPQEAEVLLVGCEKAPFSGTVEVLNLKMGRRRIPIAAVDLGVLILVGSHGGY
jgi:hypothetical protein